MIFQATLNHKLFCRLSYVATFVAIWLLFAYSSLARSMPDSFADLVENLVPAVVNVSTSQTVQAQNMMPGFDQFSFPEDSPFGNLPDLFEKFYNDKNFINRKTTSLGSGFIIDPDGYIVTNHHVVLDAEEITITFSDDTKKTAKIVGTDPKTDIAILKVETDKKLKSVKWGNSNKSRVGDWVIAIGNPFGLGGSVSAGIISARARDINAGPFDDFIQTDAAINRGNSGGPLFNIKGEVIGINSVIFTPSGGNVGIGFAVPSDLAIPIIDQLKKDGKTRRGWLGVKIQNVSDEIADSLGLDKAKGALVIDISKDSPADRAGITSGDIILTFDGKPIPTMKKLPRMVAETKINKQVDVEIWRRGKSKTLTVNIAELKEDNNDGLVEDIMDEEEIDNIKDKTEILGMQLSEITPRLRARFGLDKKTKGLIVLDVDENSKAFNKGIHPGYIIISVNQESVNTTMKFEDLIAQSKNSGRRSILLLIGRDEDSMYIALPLK